MRVPLSWLREFVEVDLTPERLAERLTLLGMEVKAIEAWGSDWRSVIVGELVSVEPHPRADRLSLTTVRVGDGTVLEIVCGATNIAPGQRVPVALPGTVLPDGRRIERADKMGATSNGMLCSGDELGLTSDADGILILPTDALVGAPLSDLFGDVVFDVDVKPNRGDALSIVGLAREVAAATGAPVQLPDTTVAESGRPVDERLSVVVEEPPLCTRFVGRWISGVRVGPAPDEVQIRLRSAGQRPVSNVVDATNYVMLELGKPTHAFDAAAVETGRLIVRLARDGERLETLDHVVRELDHDTLLIADPTRILAIAGIMGGAESEVGDSTTDVLLESAIFDPVSIRRTGQRFGLRSEASLRFEKGQEVRLARIGADRVASLIAAWAGGSVAPGRVDTNPAEPAEERVAFRPARVNSLIGTSLTLDDQRALLGRVGITTADAAAPQRIRVASAPQPLDVEAAPGEAVLANVPTWRRDLMIETDIAEEIARVHGYELVPATIPTSAPPAYRSSPLSLRDLVREILAGAGLSEVVTPALVSAELVAIFGPRTLPTPLPPGEEQAKGRPILVTNPLSSHHAVLRQSLLGSLLEVVALNRRHGREDVGIFEIGKGYGQTDEGPREWWRLAFALIGAAEPRSWNRMARDYDLDDAKGLVELLSHRLGGPLPSYASVPDERVFHPGRSARVEAAGLLTGHVGELQPGMVPAWDLRGPRLILGELAVRGIASGRVPVVQSLPVSRYPVVERDIAVVVGNAVPAAEVVATIREAGGPLLVGCRLFDVYRGAPLGADEKSLAERLAFASPDRTLTDAEIDEAIARVSQALSARLGAHLRA